MKLSSRHFLQNDAHQVDVLRDMAHLLLNDFNYGLLPPMEGMLASLEYDISPNRDRFEIILRSCNAITRGGVRILQLPHLHNKQQVSASVSATAYEGQDAATFAVVIIADPFSRIPVGEPDPDESPLRHPFSTPALRLEIVPESQLNLNYTRGHHLMIGKILWRDRQFSWVDGYLPACAVTEAHAGLVSRYEEFDQLQNELRKSAIAIVDAIYQRQAQNRPDYDVQLARNTAKLCEQIVHFLADTSFVFKNALRASPPLLLVQQVSRLAGRLSATLNLVPADERERLLTYYSQWTSVQPIGFLETLSRMVDLQYDHLNIAESLAPATAFMRMVTSLWTSLSRLEFIGKIGNNLVIGIENEYRSTSTPRHSLLD
jgi:hypothetical protein